MSNKKPVMSHDPLAGIEEEEAAGEVVVVPERSHVLNDASTSADDSGVLVLESSLTIADVSTYLETLQSSVDLVGAKQIDGRDVDIVDGAGLQLLAAFVKDLIGKTVEVSWVGASDNLVRAARQFGVYNALGLDRMDDEAA